MCVYLNVCAVCVARAGGSNYKALTEGAHSTDAIALVKEHLAGLLGDSPVSSYAKMKISKLQAAQVYAASVMFGYFLRRADRRFQVRVRVPVLCQPLESYGPLVVQHGHPHVSGLRASW